MSFCVLAKENPFGDIVALEGEFVRTFLKDMPPEFVKLYVFCQYALTNDVRCGSISELASACAVTVESVEAALEYFSSVRLQSRCVPYGRLPKRKTVSCRECFRAMEIILRHCALLLGGR